MANESSRFIKTKNAKKMVAWWYDNCDSPSHLADFIVRGTLSKKHLSEELGFARSTYQTNKRLMWAYSGIISRLVKMGLLIESGAANKSNDDSSHITQAERDKQRIKSLELKVASLKEELRQAHEKINQLGAIDDFLADCGRIPR